MTFVPSIQTFAGAHAAGGDNGQVNCAVDWANNRLWIGATVGGTNYIGRHGLITGAEQAFATAASVISGVGFPAVGWDTDGLIYGTGPNALGAGSITRANGTSFAFKSNSGYAAPNFGGINIVTLKVGNSQYALDTNIGNDIINLNNTSLSVDGVYLTSFGWYGNARSTICMGKVGSGRGYILTSPGAGSDPQTCHLQRIDLAHAATTLLATYVPTDFDAAWTEAYVNGLCLDQTDGNIMASVFGVGGSSIGYVVKLSISTGAIVWKRLLSGAPGSQQWSQSRIQHQRLAVLTTSGGNKITIIDTSDGSIISTQTTGLAGLTIWGQQAYDDTKGCIVGMFDVNSAAGGPTLLNSSAYGFRGWGALYVAAASATPGTPNGPATSRKRAWTFTLDGHTFYVLDLGAEGTWLYDKTTQEWSNWYTDTYVQWNVANGCMWGDRIVGGDLSTSDVYEVAASNIQDNGAVNIPHCVTGGITTRSRDGFSLDALLLSASRGELGAVAGTTLNMQFSDDNGETWSGYFPISLAEADYSQDLRWASLGNFQAPGRIFEISDDGGPISLDGLDAFMDGFDDEQGPQQG